MGYTYLNLLDSPELFEILMTLTIVIKPLLPNFLGMAIVILNRKAFSKFYRRHGALVAKYSVSLKTLLQQSISEPEFYGDGKPPMVYCTDRSKAVVPVLVLLFVALWFILRGDLFYVLPCVILFLCFFSPFSILITSLGEERAYLSAFRTFVRFVLVWICGIPLPLGVWEGLRFLMVIVALPGLLSYLFSVQI